MDVLICRTADYSRMVVVVDGVVMMDSDRVGLMHDEVSLVEVYARAGANITLASLPPGTQMVI